jgi:ribulose-bisphosphate carboxylase large chain
LTTAARLTAVYHVRDTAQRIDARARAIAVEQSVEMPVEAVTDRTVLENIVGQVEGVRELEPGRFEVRIGLAVATFSTANGPEPGQMLNMLFGNSSILDDVTLADAIIPDSVLAAFGGPGHGLAGLRARSGAKNRALTCSALKPQGLDAKGLAAIAAELAAGGLDFIKDDHGLADQAYSPFAERVPRIAEAVAAARRDGRTGYLPSLNGHLEQMRRQVEIVRAAGLDAVLIAPMIAGLATFHALVTENPDIAFMAHPAMAGASRLAPPLLLGKLFRLLGADATVFPNHGGRFGYSPQTCRDLASAALGPFGGLRATVPVPAGGMTPDRVPEMLQFYGSDVMLLIGGGLLAAGPRMRDEAARFTAAVATGVA